MAMPVAGTGLDPAGAGTGAGYTGMVDMQGMQIPVLDGVAHFKGKNFQVGTTGAVMDEKGAIQGFVEDGVVNPPDPMKVRNFMNGQSTTPAANSSVTQSLAALKDNLTPSLSSLLGGESTKDMLQSALDIKGIKGGIQSAKNEVKAGAIKKLLGLRTV